MPLVPVILWGTQRMMTKDHPRDFSRGTTHLAAGRAGRCTPRRTDPVAETAELKRVMAELLGESILAYPAAEQPPGSWWVPASLGGSAPTLDGGRGDGCRGEGGSGGAPGGPDDPQAASLLSPAAQGSAPGGQRSKPTECVRYLCRLITTATFCRRRAC